MRYRVVVSFGSECCGTDEKGRRSLEKVVGGYPIKALGEVRGHWGKEGEYDVCFTLDGLSVADRARFVAQVKTAVSRKLVAVEENATCHADR
jgi:hypothetical protein